MYRVILKMCFTKYKIVRKQYFWEKILLLVLLILLFLFFYNTIVSFKFHISNQFFFFEEFSIIIHKNEIENN